MMLSIAKSDKLGFAKNKLLIILLNIFYIQALDGFLKRQIANFATLRTQLLNISSARIKLT